MNNWWHATVHWVAIVVGVGVLTFPSDLVYLSWWPGLLMIGICWVGTLHSLWKMIQFHDEGADSFAGLGRLAWGARGASLMRFLQVFSSLSVNISYLIVGSDSVHALFGNWGGSVPALFQIWAGLVIFSAVQVIGSMVSSLSGLVPFSAVSLLATIGCVVAVIGLTIHARHSVPAAQLSIPEAHRIPKTFNALGNIGFAFSGHYLAMEVQSSLACAGSAKEPMWNGMLMSYTIIALCYFPVAAIGYWTFGNLTCYGNILLILQHPSWASKLANAMLILHLTISYQVRALPIYEILEHFRSKRLYLSWMPRLAVRSLLIAFTCLVAALVPFPNEIIGIVGGIALIPSAFIMPCLVWLSIRKPKALTLSWLVVVAWVAFGFVLAILAVVGGTWSLLVVEIYSKRNFLHPLYRDCLHEGRH